MQNRMVYSNTTRNGKQVDHKNIEIFSKFFIDMGLMLLSCIYMLMGRFMAGVYRYGIC